MIVVGNLKMNQSLSEATEYEKRLVNSGIIICPSFPYLTIYNQEGYFLGAQNVSEYDNGPYTGDVSATQLKSLNVPYVLIGHSERRHVFQETQETINNKIIKSLENNLKVIYCVGETYEEKQQKQTFNVIEKQVVDLFMQIPENKIKDIIIGYEPVWAISDGINPGSTPLNSDIEEVNSFIKLLFKQRYNIEINVLYGGSVNLKNIEELLTLKNNDGFLIGGASKNIDDLLQINKLCKQQK